MANKNLLKKASLAALSATVALSGMPAAAFAADFTDSEVVVADEAETEAQEPEAEAEAEEAVAEEEASVDAEEVPAETDAEEAPAEETVEEDAFSSEAEVFSDDTVDEAGEAEYVYGTANISYADYFYGELNEVAENATMDLTAADKVAAAGYREDGMYDTITCATNSKSMKYATAWGEAKDSGAELYGIKDVNIAVPKTLYDEATAAITAGQTCNNKLLEIIGSMTVSESAPASGEYKVLNGDGTLTAMKTEVTQVSDGSATISTDSVWGDYQIEVDFGANADAIKPTTSNILGIVVETSDGEKYGMLHSQNTWLQTQEFAFAVTEGFVEPHKNTIDYKRFADIQGKTITSITYLVKDSADLTVSTSLYCKYKLNDEEVIKGTASKAYDKDGATVQMTWTNCPADSSYALASVEFNDETLTEGTDYTYNTETNVLTILNTDKTSAGTYSLTFTDTKGVSEDLYTDVIVESGLKDGDVKIVDNKLVVDSDIYTVSDYLATVSATTVDGTKVEGGRRDAANAAAVAIFDTEGNANLYARVNSKDVFSGSAESYEVSFTSSAFPAVTGTIKESEYRYVYAGLTWEEYWAAEGVYNATNTESSSTLDRRSEADMGGFDAVTRATTNHGLHRGSFQSTAVISTESGKTYTISYWKDKSTVVFTDGTSAAVSGKTLTFTSRNGTTTDTMTGYKVVGIKYVPVKVKSTDYAAFCSKYTVARPGETLAGGYAENQLKSYSYTSDVNETTNGLKTATNDGSGNFSFSARTTGTTSGIKDAALKTASDITVTVKPGAGGYGEFLRVDLTGDGYGELGSAMQAVKWTYYGDGDTVLATYGTKFAADNWMHKSMGIQLGLTDSLRCKLPEGTDGTGKWVITVYALGYNDYTFTINAAEENIAKEAGDADATPLKNLIAEAEALKEADYTPESWAAAYADIQAELEECKDMLEIIANQTQYGIEEQMGHLTEAMGKLVKATATINASSKTLYVKKTATLKVTTNLTGTVTWSSSNAKVATVDQNGKVTAVKAGTATITATVGAKSVTCKVTVKTPSITAKAAASTIYTKGKTTTTIKVTKSGVSGTAKFSSSNKKIATVSSKGVVTAKKAGTVKITVTVGSYKKVVTIKVKTPTLKLTKTSATIKKGKTTTIKVKATPTGKVTYKSSNKKVATVSSKGVVKGVKKGTATITVTCNGVKKTFKVTVK